MPEAGEQAWAGQGFRLLRRASALSPRSPPPPPPPPPSRCEPSSPRSPRRRPTRGARSRPRPRSARRGIAVSGMAGAPQAVEHRRRRDVGDREAAAAGPRRGVVEQALEALELRQRRRERGVPASGAGASAPSPRRRAGRTRPPRSEAARAQEGRDRVEQPVDPGAIGQVGRIDLRVARARREVAEDGVRLGQVEVVVDDRRDAAERIDGEVPVGARLANGTSRNSAVWPSSASRKRTFWAFDERALSWSTSDMENLLGISRGTLAFRRGIRSDIRSGRDPGRRRELCRKFPGEMDLDLVQHPGFQ